MRAMHTTDTSHFSFSDPLAAERLTLGEAPEPLVPRFAAEDEEDEDEDDDEDLDEDDDFDDDDEESEDEDDEEDPEKLEL
jgi:hypothetical protein